MSKNGFDSAPNLASALGIALKNNGRSSFQIDCERYRAFFDDQTISDEQKDQLIEMLFTIGHAFYDAGFAYEFASVDSSQACGKHEETQDDYAVRGQGVLSSPEITLSKKFNLCAAE